VLGNQLAGVHAVKDITCLIAHPDDEVLFAWPVWSRIAHIVCITSDLGNTERPAHQQNGERKECLKEVGIALGCAVTCFDLHSEFYRLPTRNGALKRSMQGVIDVGLAGAETVFAHNAHGEYGHLDHILTHHVARCCQAQSGCELLVSDICIESNWLPMPIRGGELYQLPGEFIGNRRLDRARFDELKAIYDKRGCWTWSQEPVETCGVYRI